MCRRLSRQGHDVAAALAGGGSAAAAAPSRAMDGVASMDVVPPGELLPLGPYPFPFHEVGVNVYTVH
ncbi:MAG TPA: hypothetical protein VF221_08495 [Chloroflexota bacterium]